MILVTGANGQTGRAIIKALLAKGEKVRALVYDTRQAEEINALGEMETVVGNMLNQNDVNAAFSGVRASYHICSAFNPDEVKIGQIAINAAVSAKVEHFIYHSVLHSVLQDMPHHQKKLMTEELVVNSGLPYTIIQPTVFMQNISETWKSLTENGVFKQKFFTEKNTRMCLLDLADLAEAIAVILTTPGHTGCTYELCGPDNLTLTDMVSAMEENFNRKIIVETIPDEALKAQLTRFGASEYLIESILKMFHHYNDYDFVGNPNVLTWILGRKPNNFSAFVGNAIKNGI